MQPLGLKSTALAKYHARLFGSHDYEIDVEILDLNENVLGTARFLDGQVNLQDRSSAIRRTCSLTVSDVAGALDYVGASAWSGSTVWVDRLIRVRHTLYVPTVGSVTVTPFIGPPSAISRRGAEVSLECQDKAALAVRGASPLTVQKGMNAVSAIRQILARCTGEFRFRLGTSGRRLSRNYSVGWSDEASPWLVASEIARRELGLQLLYSCDGYATLRARPNTVALTVPHVTAEPAAGVDFTSISNWVRVAGKQTSKTKGQVTTTKQPVATAVVTSGQLSPTALARKGVKRYLPLLVDDDAYTKISQVKGRADRELDNAARLQSDPALTCVPFFHADVDDLIKFNVPGSDLTLALSSGSIPLGPNEMTVGAVRWVSRPPRNKIRTHMIRTRKVAKKKKAKSTKGRRPTKKR